MDADVGPSETEGSPRPGEPEGGSGEPEGGWARVPDGGVAGRIAVVLGVAALVFGLDQLTKWWALDALADGPVHVIWTLRLILVENRGTAFSLTNRGGPVIAVLALTVVGVLFWFGRGVSSKLGLVAMGMVAGGALGNLADRALRAHTGVLSGGVVDFIDFRWWPVFNVADMGIVVGGLLLVAVFVLFPAAEG